MYEFELEVFIVKKLLTVVLAFALVLSLGALAFAGTDTVIVGCTETVKVPSPSKTDIEVIHGPTVAPAPVPVGDGAGKVVGSLIVKFDTGEIRVATPIASPFNDAQNTAVALADKVITAADAVEDEALKAFFAENAGSLAAGVINMGGEAVDGSVSLAVDATGFEKVMFTAPGNAENLGFVVLNG